MLLGRGGKDFIANTGENKLHTLISTCTLRSISILLAESCWDRDIW